MARVIINFRNNKNAAPTKIANKTPAAMNNEVRGFAAESLAFATGAVACGAGAGVSGAVTGGAVLATTGGATNVPRNR